jgi:hypothetical protein
MEVFRQKMWKYSALLAGVSAKTAGLLRKMPGLQKMPKRKTLI